ncbi:TetR/AcrR family transcriptional regulator [Pontibacillus litoralis]|uniref:TetR family transcriptional regulator n=1 Tax=Pontibacillus litoralis JSM 072002 TaxID=1385512 RepID=A0A0A5G347_9BACI|nr:TetR/AcrR family transcriptional regulator [Pontibacillus litoralis]KGX86474.1 TetR family transcriptional regulator [Pontibacillus litoralis JSM 072002]
MKKVPSSIKDERLIKVRRDQMIKGAVSLFKEKGFHKTTTREIAKASGFSIGTLYEYIRTKEDVLFLVCDYIYERVKDQMGKKIDMDNMDEYSLKEAISAYFQLMDDMQDEVVVMYQEVKSLSKDAQEYVLNKERDMLELFEHVIKRSFPNEMTEEDVKLLANNIFIQGQMWGFRRWILHKQFSLEAYTNRQLHYLFHGLSITRGK